jgi:streptogramin lyase
MNVFSARALATLTAVALTMNTFNAESQTIQEFPLPADSTPTQIVAGPDGNYWFTEGTANRIGIVSPDGRSLIERPLPTPNANPQGITLGPDGNLWFVEESAMQIGRMKIDGSVEEFPTRCSPSGFIIAGPDENVWFPEECAGTHQDFIGEVSTGKFAGGIFEHYVGEGREIKDLVWASNGNIWFTENTANEMSEPALGELDEAGTIIESAIPSGDPLSRIAVGPDGNLWFPENIIPAKLARSTSTGSILEFDWPDTTTRFSSITSGSDGNLWLTSADDVIWRVATSESSIIQTKYPLHFGSTPASLTPGAEQQLWFVEITGDKIGVVYLDGIFRNDFEAD